MFKLRMKSLWHAMPYLAICLIFIIGQWKFFSRVLWGLPEGSWAMLSDRGQTEFMATIICWGILIVMLVFIFSGRCQKAINKYIQNSASPELEREKVEKFLEEAPYIYNLQYDKDFVCGRNSVFTVFLQTKDIVKIRKRIKLHRYMVIIPICKLCYLDITTADGKTKSVSFRREKHMDEAIEALRTVCYTGRME